MKLRPYQSDLVKRSIDSINLGKATLLQLPTGGGKTTIAAEIIRRFLYSKRRIWFVCHRQEIMNQAVVALASFGIEAALVASRKPMDRDSLVQVCSVGALPHRVTKMREPWLIIWDECHHMASPSWSKLREQFPDAHHLGLTATPERLDGVGLDSWFDELICGPSAHDLIEDGFLSRFRVFAPTIPDMRSVKSGKGDYLRSSLSAAMDKPSLVGDVVDHYKRLAGGKRALVFAASIEASQHVVERFQSAGVAALHIDAGTPALDRKQAIERLASGEIRVLSNVELFTEGFDCPAVDAVILLRPTQSLALYQQMIGRGLRTAEGKEATIILDHSGLVHRHGMPDEPVAWSLGGELRRERRGGTKLRRCPECSAIHDWAGECVECGHVYAEADRSIDEAYGELQEFKAPEGFETSASFAKRRGISAATVVHYVQAGMPHIRTNANVWIDYQKAVEWLDLNWNGRNRSLELESAEKFGKRIGVSKLKVYAMMRDGMPSLNRLALISEAIDWVRSNKTNIPQDGEETRAAFAKRLKIDSTKLKSFVEAGLPVSPNGCINIARGLNFASNNMVNRRRPIAVDDENNLVKSTEFRKEKGISSSKFGKMIAAGFPTLSPQKGVGHTIWIDRRQAEKWLKTANGTSKYKRFVSVSEVSHVTP